VHSLSGADCHLPLPASRILLVHLPVPGGIAFWKANCGAGIIPCCPETHLRLRLLVVFPPLVSLSRAPGTDPVGLVSLLLCRCPLVSLLS